MSAETTDSEQPGQALARMMVTHRTFLEGVYSLMRFLEAEMTRRGWELIRNGGYGVTKNGGGRGLANFATADWVVNQVGIAFVDPTKTTASAGGTNTRIPPEGLELLAFQVRWLERSPEEPVVWRAKLTIEPEGAGTPNKWEDYQTSILNHLEPQAHAHGQHAGEVKPSRWVTRGAGIVYRGTYFEVPVVNITSPDDAISQLVDVQSLDIH